MTFLLSIIAVIVSAWLYKTAVYDFVNREQKSKDIANRKVTTTLPDEQLSFNEWSEFINRKN